MKRSGPVGQKYGSLLLLLLAVAATSATLIVSCGGGGGDSDGSLCSQCGLSPDGPCQSEVFVVPGPDAPAPCKDPNLPNPCGPIELTCRRKVDSAQQRCFPLSTDPFFKCDGSRPGGTAVPEPTPVPTTTVASDCGNNVIEGDEQCDGTDLDGQTCTDLCSLPGGILSCFISNCTFNFNLCNGVCNANN